MKKLLLFVMILLPMVANAYDIEVQNEDGVTIYYNYTNDGMELEVTYCGNHVTIINSKTYSEDYRGKVVIPEEVTYMNRTRKVTSIGYRAFKSCGFLTSVTIPNSVTSIGENAFEMCSDLISVIIPDSVTSIEKKTFYECSSLTSVTIPNSVTSIGDDAFGNCSGLTSVVIPNSVTSIGGWAFGGCSGLTSVIIPNSVTSIEGGAFCGCTGLTSVTIPNSVTSIGPRTFDEVNLSIVISQIENPLKIYGKTSFSKTFSTNTFNNATLYVPTGTIDKYKKTEGWKDFLFLEEGDYVGIYKLTYMVDGEVFKSYDVIYGETITPEPTPTKEGYSFSGWSDIPETMPDHDVIVTGTFSINKYKLTYKVDGAEYKSFDVEYGATITPESAPTKEGYSFSGWSDIPETMPANDVTVTGTFSVNKYKLTYTVDGEVYKSYDVEYGATITPEPVPTKEGFTFSGWSDIPETMPANDVTVTGTFSVNKYKLTYTVDGEVYKSYDVEYGATITLEPAPTKEGFTFSGWSDIPETMPAYDVTITGTFTQIDYVVGETTYEIQNDEVSIKDGSNQSGDVEIQATVVINDQSYTVTSIDENAFKGNSSITSVTIPNSITQIGANAFEGCTGLSEITIGNGIATIGSKAFANIVKTSNARSRATGTGLKVSCYSESVPFTASNAFENTPISNGTLLVEDNSVTDYKNSAPWSEFGTIMGFKEATGIDRILYDENVKTKIFSIDGKALNTPQRGINIINGKKIVIK